MPKPRVHHPSHGWGTVRFVRHNLLHGLYPDAGHPAFHAFVRWDAGGGGAINPDNPSLTWEGASEFARMVREEAEPPAGPTMLPVFP